MFQVTVTHLPDERNFYSIVRQTAEEISHQSSSYKLNHRGKCPREETPPGLEENPRKIWVASTSRLPLQSVWVIYDPSRGKSRLPLFAFWIVMTPRRHLLTSAPVSVAGKPAIDVLQDVAYKIQCQFVHLRWLRRTKVKVGGMFLAIHVVAVTREMAGSHVASVGIHGRLQLTLLTTLVVVAANMMSDGFS
jgi:hypothetical protein